METAYIIVRGSMLMEKWRACSLAASRMAGRALRAVVRKWRAEEPRKRACQR